MDFPGASELASCLISDNDDDDDDDEDDDEDDVAAGGGCLLLSPQAGIIVRNTKQSIHLIHKGHRWWRVFRCASTSTTYNTFSLLISLSPFSPVNSSHWQAIVQLTHPPAFGVSFFPKYEDIEMANKTILSGRK